MRRPLLTLMVLLGVVQGGRTVVRAEEPPAWEPAKTWALLVGTLSWKDTSLTTYPVHL